MPTYDLTGHTYPKTFRFPIGQHSVRTHMNGIRSDVTIEIDSECGVSCSVTSEHEWDLDDLIGHVEDMVQTILNAVAFHSGVTCEVFFHHIFCRENQEERLLEMVLDSANPSGADFKTLEQAFTLINVLSSEHGWHLTRSLDDFRRALRHSLSGGFYCYRSIECLRIYCRDKYGISGRSEQWRKVREIAQVERRDIEKIKAFADDSRHGDFRGISSADRHRLIRRTGGIIQRFLFGEFGDPNDGT
ncbi:MAG: hypothetical protein AAFR75_05070 [Pseudomonadota bacterium]